MRGRASPAITCWASRCKARRKPEPLSIMPTYEYICTKCEDEFEFSHSMSSPALTICPKELCGLKRWGRGKVKKKIGAGAGLIFKGSGFYITDYRSEKYKEAAKKDSSAAAPASSDTGSGKSSGGDGKASGGDGLS